MVAGSVAVRAPLRAVMNTGYLPSGVVGFVAIWMVAPRVVGVISAVASGGSPETAKPIESANPPLVSTVTMKLDACAVEAPAATVVELTTRNRLW